MKHWDTLWLNVNLATMSPARDQAYGAIKNAAIATKNGRIDWLGPAHQLPEYATEKLIDKLGLGKQLRFVSGISTEEMVRYYNQAHVAVVPSLYEGFGLPAGEAMACGAPLVSSTGGALPEVVGDAGIQVPAGDSAAIARAVERLFEDPALCERYASAGRARIETTFCWRIAAAQMVEYYHQMISEKHENR